MKAKKGTLHIMRGLPGSGKSTEAKRLLSRNFNQIRILRLNKSELRRMLWPEFKWNPDYEKIVQSLEMGMAEVLLKQGFDVIIDSTNLSNKSIARWKVEFKKVKILVYNKMNTSIEVCLSRNQQRLDTPNYCPPELIYSLAKRNGLLEKEINKNAN